MELICCEEMLHCRKVLIINVIKIISVQLAVQLNRWVRLI